MAGAPEPAVVTVVGYAFEEAWQPAASGRSALVSIGTIAIAFATLGGFLLVSVNVQGVLDAGCRPPRCRSTCTTPRREADRARARAVPAGAAGGGGGRIRVARARARALPRRLSRAARRHDRASARIRFRRRSKCGCGPATAAMRRPTTCRERWPGKPGVADVRYDRRWLARLVGIVTTARLAAGAGRPAS